MQGTQGRVSEHCMHEVSQAPCGPAATTRFAWACLTATKSHCAIPNRQCRPHFCCIAWREMHRQLQRGVGQCFFRENIDASLASRGRWGCCLGSSSCRAALKRSTLPGLACFGTSNIRMRPHGSVVESSVLFIRGRWKLISQRASGGVHSKRAKSRRCLGWMNVTEVVGECPLGAESGLRLRRDTPSLSARVEGATVVGSMRGEGGSPSKADAASPIVSGYPQCAAPCFQGHAVDAGGKAPTIQ